MIDDLDNKTLDQLAAIMRETYTIHKTERHDFDKWSNATYLFCATCLSGRSHFPTNETWPFSKWLKSIFPELPNNNIVTSAIALAKTGDELRTQLTTTPWKSISRLHHHLCPPRSRVKAEVDRRNASGQTLDWDAIRKDAAVSEVVVRVVEENLKVTTRYEALIKDRRSESDQQRIDRILADERAAMREELKTEIALEFKAVYRDHLLPQYASQLAEADMIKRRHEGFITKADWNKIRRCLHPDTAPHSSDEARNEAFRLLSQHEKILVRQPADPVAPLFRANALNELMELKARQDELNRQRRAQRKG